MAYFISFFAGAFIGMSLMSICAAARSNSYENEINEKRMNDEDTN